MAKLKQISFLGTGKYGATRYVWGEDFFETRLFPEAAFKIFKPDSVYLLVTDTSKKSCTEDGEAYCDLLMKTIGSLKIIDIPEGTDEEQLWRLFEVLSNIVEEGDRLLLDVTHAFRSLPLFVFTAAIYLRRTKGAEIERIIYGAYEARDKQANSTPIFDLTPLLELVEWISGAEALIASGNAGPLAKGLKEYRPKGAYPEPKVRKIANKLEFLSKALRLSRPLDVMECAEELKAILESCDNRDFPKPFLTVLQQIKSDMSKLAHKNPKELSKDNLSRQIDIMEYFLDKGMVVQAVTLAREWIISFVCLKEGKEDWLNHKVRSDVEDRLNDALKSKMDNKDIPVAFDDGDLLKAWSKMQIRNQIAHCGMGESISKISTIEDSAIEMVSLLKRILSS